MFHIFLPFKTSLFSPVMCLPKPDGIQPCLWEPCPSAPASLLPWDRFTPPFLARMDPKSCTVRFAGSTAGCHSVAWRSGLQTCSLVTAHPAHPWLRPGCASALTYISRSPALPSSPWSSSSQPHLRAHLTLHPTPGWASPLLPSPRRVPQALDRLPASHLLAAPSRQ